MRKKFQIRDGANSFTLLEMLGVLAVMAILASVAVPPMLRSLQNAQSVNEDKNLEEIGRALCEAIKAEGQVPNPNSLPTDTSYGSKGWVAMTAPYCSMASEAIQYVFPGQTETERRFYILRIIGLTPSLISPGSYQVPPNGWGTAINWQDIQTSLLVLISSSKPDYLLSCPANGSATIATWAGLAGPAAVNWAAKEWVKQATNGVYSATNTQIVGTIQNTSGTETWTDKGQFLHVKVIPMNNLICKISFAGPIPVLGINGVPSGTDSVFMTRGSSVSVSDGAPSPYTANATATAASAFLNFTYTPYGGGDEGFGSWAVTP